MPNKRIDGRIIAFLSTQDWPVTTEMVAKGLRVGWKTAEEHLRRLQTNGTVRGKRIGRQNQWVLKRLAWEDTEALTGNVKTKSA